MDYYSNVNKIEVKDKFKNKQEESKYLPEPLRVKIRNKNKNIKGVRRSMPDLINSKSRKHRK